MSHQPAARIDVARSRWVGDIYSLAMVTEQYWQREGHNGFKIGDQV
jgi:hypothetical protein